MSEPLNWDEFRIVKAIAEAQSLGGAAERLGLNHSTMFRRLTAMETRLGVKLFERDRAGYRPTAAGEDMVALARLMGDTIAEFERRVAQSDIKLSGRVRVGATNSLGVLMLPAICADLTGAHPDLHVELVLSESSLDLERGDADLALRCLYEAPPEYVTGRRLPPSPWAIYAAAGLAGGVEGRAAKCPWIVPSDGCGPSRVRHWLDRNVEVWRRTASASSDIAMAELAARGVGAALLPCYVALTKPELQRIGKADPELDGDLWLMASERALRTPRVRAVFDILGDELERRRAWFAGEAVVDA